MACEVKTIKSSRPVFGLPKEQSGNDLPLMLLSLGSTFGFKILPRTEVEEKEKKLLLTIHK